MVAFSILYDICVLPRLVAYKDPNMPPKDPVRYSTPKALPRLLACIADVLLLAHLDFLKNR